MSLNGNSELVCKLLKLLLGEVDLLIRFLALRVKFAAFDAFYRRVFLIFVFVFNLYDFEIAMDRMEKEIFSRNSLHVNNLA